MSLPKAQLVDPQGNMNLPGMTATGIVTATSLKGVTTGSVTNLTGSPDLDVGIVTGSSFVGDGTGHAANITGTPELNLGVTTATSFVGDAVGKAAGLTGTPNLNVGLITATSFVGFVTGDVTGNISGNVVGNITGDISGLAGGLGINGINVWTGAGTSNLGVGVCTATLLYGDASGMVGAGSSAYIAQEVTATGYGGDTIIDLTYGNLIYYKGESVTTVGFASTSAVEQITFIRDPAPVTYDNSVSTASVDFDSGDNLTQTTDAVLRNWFDQAFTVEYWIYADAFASTDSGSGNALGASTLGSNSNFTWSFGPNGLGQVRFAWWNGSADSAIVPTQTLSTGTWYHLAFVHDGSNNCSIFIDGVLQTLTTGTGTSYPITNGTADGGTFNIGKVQTTNFDGKISNLRITHQALYTNTFIPPSAALTTTSQNAVASNVKLLCCQSSTDDTAATVTPNTISANGTPTPGAETITQSGSLTATITWPDRVKWDGGTTPTLFTNARSAASQIFHFTTVDTGLNYNAWEEIKNNAETFGLYGAGPSGYGALGINVAPGTNYSSPVQVPGTSWSSLIDTGWAAAVGGAIKSDGTMWVWGSTNYGILGLNVYGAGLSDSVSSPIQLGTETTWDNACFGGNNSAGCMAVKTDGSLWGWGQNRYGTLGLNDAGIPGSLPDEYRNSRSSPTQVGTDTTWKFVNYGGEDVILAIKTNGTLWSWGGNSAGAAGQNTPATTPSLRSSPVQVGTDTSWAYASNCRTGTSIATKTDGTLWCWGDNGEGQLGLNESEIGAPTWTSPQRSSPTQVGSGTDWNYDNEGKISAGYQRVFAIKTDGTLYGWGRSHQGQLGLNEGGYKDYSSPVQIPGTNWSTIKSVGEVIATKTDGTLWTWGDNGEGKGMLNSDVDRSSPTQVPGTWKSGERGIRSGSPQFALKVE
jgi:hypothetical protein